MAEFIFKKNNDLITFTNYDDIPSDLDYDHVIKFLPDLPPSPHSKEQHEEMELWNEKLQKFMSKERG